MIRGLRRVLDDEQMARLDKGALRILENVGLQIRGRFLLEALAEAGCKVDFENCRAWFKPELVEKQISAQRDRYKMVRSSLWYPFCRAMPKDDAAIPDEFAVDYGYGVPWMFDYSQSKCRKPTVQDQIDMIKLGNALDAVKAVNAPFICREFDPKMEIIESARILLLNTRKPGWVGTSSGKEVKYLAELAALAAGENKDMLTTQPPIVVSAYCTTSPLKIDNRSCEVLAEALKYGFPVNFAPMPILGATAPVTPSGAVIIAAAEILGCITATSLINAEVYYYSTSISAEMDMKTTQICFCTPAAILTDAALHQLFRYKYGLVHNVEPGYIEAKRPGIQAAWMKAFRQMAFAETVSLSLPIGVLDNATVFSPAQAMIDLDVSRAMYKFSRGMEVNDETMCLDLIEQLGFCEKRAYLDTEHTFENFRKTCWDSSYFDRTYSSPDRSDNVRGDDDMLAKAERDWRELVESQEPLEVEAKFAEQLDRVVEAARKEL